MFYSCSFTVCCSTATLEYIGCTCRACLVIRNSRTLFKVQQSPGEYLILVCKRGKSSPTLHLLGEPFHSQFPINKIGAETFSL